MNPLWKSRITMIVVVAMFFASFGVALYLIRSGWNPTATRNVGELLQPARALGELGLQRLDGSAYAWEPDRRLWRIVVLPPRDCGQPCQQLADQLHRIWISEGRHADRVHVLWFGEVPQGVPEYRSFLPMLPSEALRRQLPAHVDGELSAYLVDPSGFLVMRYPPGFDPSGMGRDLSRLLRVTQ